MRLLELLRFNPRAREGRDEHLFLFADLFLVSIHAPARGATPLVRRGFVQGRQFQSTRPRGARLSGIFVGGLKGCFNPRASEGRDGVLCFAQIASQRFNPRAREGRDS